MNHLTLAGWKKEEEEERMEGVTRQQIMNLGASSRGYGTSEYNQSKMHSHKSLKMNLTKNA